MVSSEEMPSSMDREETALKSPEPPHLSIVIPAYNEEARIGQSLEKIIAYFQNSKCDYEIIIVNDGSDDRTAEVARSYFDGPVRGTILNNKMNTGKGYSVKKGMLTAKGRYILFSDTDLSTPIQEVEKLFQALHAGCDIAIGSRALPSSKVSVHQKWYRETGGRIFNKVVQMLTLPGIKDTQCGFKCFSREAAQKVFPRQKLEGWSFDVEILYIARRLGLLIREVPVEWRNSFDSRVSFLKDGLRMVMDLIKIRYVHRKIGLPGNI
jgi:dolichyl-phosphate beta-glucosyltransferase